jgi:hypothetical protein
MIVSFPDKEVNLGYAVMIPQYGPMGNRVPSRFWNCLGTENVSRLLKETEVPKQK